MEGKNIKIKRTSMRDQAYSILQDWIIVGELEPGWKLRDTELSELLGISRTPIREALLRLEDEGLVETKANRWTIVSYIDVEQAKHIYSIVEVLEKLAIEQGINNVDKKVIGKLESVNENFKTELDEGKKAEAFQSDMKFHETIIKLSNNDELINILSNLKLKIKRMEIYYFKKHSDSLQSYYEHREIIENLKIKDIFSIIESIQKNWKNSLSRIQNKVLNDR